MDTEGFTDLTDEARKSAVTAWIRKANAEYDSRGRNKPKHDQAGDPPERVRLIDWMRDPTLISISDEPSFTITLNRDALFEHRYLPGSKVYLPKGFAWTLGNHRAVSYTFSKGEAPQTSESGAIVHPWMPGHHSLVQYCSDSGEWIAPPEPSPQETGRTASRPRRALDELVKLASRFYPGFSEDDDL